MRIVIDVRCLAEGRRTGVEEYTRYLLVNLFEIDKKNKYILFFNSWKKTQIDFSWIDKYSNVTLKKFNFPNKILNLLFWYFNWPKIDMLVGGADIVFMPNIIFGSVSQKTKLILTIHDLSFERYGECFSWKRRWWHIFVNPLKICRNAYRIIAVSESTKNDLISLYKLEPFKIEVVLSACSEKFAIFDRNNQKLITVKEKYGLPYKFILYLGTIEPRKNIIGIIKAYNLLQSWALSKKDLKIKKFDLVIAGEKGWLNDKIFLEINKSPFKNKIKVIDFVYDQDKEYVYNLASLFVYPSFFEGFGFPPIEAAKCGLPIISSNNSSLPETIGEFAIMIDPDKPDEIFQSMREILTSEELRESLVKKGIEKTKELSWKKTAEKVLAVFNK